MDPIMEKNMNIIMKYSMINLSFNKINKKNRQRMNLKKNLFI